MVLTLLVSDRETRILLALKSILRKKSQEMEKTNMLKKTSVTLLSGMVLSAHLMMRLEFQKMLIKTSEKL
jgi:hypothetical protein